MNEKNLIITLSSIKDWLDADKPLKVSIFFANNEWVNKFD